MVSTPSLSSVAAWTKLSFSSYWLNRLVPWRRWWSSVAALLRRIDTLLCRRHSIVALLLTIALLLLWGISTLLLTISVLPWISTLLLTISLLPWISALLRPAIAKLGWCRRTTCTTTALLIFTV